MAARWLAAYPLTETVREQKPRAIHSTFVLSTRRAWPGQSRQQVDKLAF